MGKKSKWTTNTKIKTTLRRLFLQSRERSEAMKREKYTCQKCGVKQSRTKGKEVYVEAHHIEGVCNWDEIYIAIRKNLLCNPDMIQILCKECHREETNDMSNMLQEKGDSKASSSKPKNKIRKPLS